MSVSCAISKKYYSQDISMIWLVFVFVTAVKLLLIPAYRSTDFEVHRNWLAITYSLPVSQWYLESTSEWTLDYPPFFAYFEYVLSHIAKFFDPMMLDVKNLNYASKNTVLFQRLSVMMSDVVLVAGTKMCIKSFQLKDSTKSLILSCLILCNVGLLFVDHIHFQYNGFLFGVLLLSIAYMVQKQYLISAMFFVILLNLKHIFLYVAPVYTVFLLNHYCLRGNSALVNLSKLILLIFSCTALSFGPFLNQLPQVISRLFPFKRGLTHAYWAPNFWAIYNFLDKIGAKLLKVPDYSKNTGGLVQEYEHCLFPSVSPLTSLVLTVVLMLPCVTKILLSTIKKPSMEFLKAVVICSCTSFMFGWHVHEKAILMVIIPLSLLAVQDKYDAKMMLFLSLVGHFSLFPLLFKPELLLVKYSLYVAYSLLMYIGLQFVHPSLKMEWHLKLYLVGLIVICIYENLLQYVLKLDEQLPFLPLMITSVYCSVGIIYFYIIYYYKFLSAEKVVPKKKKKKIK